MLDALRTAAGTWVSKLLLSILVISFAVWGISGRMSGGLAGHAVVTAGSTKVSDVDYRLAFDRQVNVLSQRLGQRLTPEQAAAFGIDQQVVQQLVAGAVLDEQARRLGLGLSKDRIAKLTIDDPAFRGPDGAFDRQRFESILQQVGMRPQDYFRNQAEVATRQQIVEAVSDGMKAPDAYLKAVALYRGEDRTVDYLTLPATSADPVPAPTDADLQTYFDAHKQTYAAPEYRKLSLVKLSPEDIADEKTSADADVKAEYDRSLARYTTPETRTVDQLVFKDRAAAEAAVSAMSNGTPFDKLVEQEGKTPQDITLGTVTKDKITDKVIADAAFGLAQGQVSGVVDGAFGPVLVRVTAIQQQVVKTYDEVAPQIRKELAVADATRAITDARNTYEDSRAAGETMAEAAAKLRLKIITIDAVDRAGLRPDGTVITDIPASEAVLRGAFETETGADNPSVPLQSNGYVYYQVDGITPARDRTLAEVRDRVVADWTKTETEKRLLDKANDYAKRIRDGATLDTIAAELKLDKQTKRGLKRDADDADFGKDGVSAVFDVTDGGTGVFAAPTGDTKMLFKVVETTEPAGAGPDTIAEAERKQMAAGMADDMLDELVAQLTRDYSVGVDRDAMARALAAR